MIDGIHIQIEFPDLLVILAFLTLMVIMVFSAQRNDSPILAFLTLTVIMVGVWLK